ncbi:MAG: hypothetical protein ACJAS4_002231 [Bacteriovoracaceae bacterium]|jgi:hypothetical protein
MEKINNSINNCSKLLEKLSASCCQGQKSKRMNKLVDTLKEISKLNESGLDEIIQHVTECGGVIGELHVSCCVNGKEKVYREILSELNQVFVNAWKMKGIHH